MRSLVLLSGGIDSTLALHRAILESEETIGLFMNYGQRLHDQEYIAALQIVNYYQVQLITQILPSSLMRSNLLDAADNLINPKDAVVPFRNGIFLALAAGIAASRGYDTIWTGMYQDGEFVFQDETPEFLSAMEHAMYSGAGIQLRNPLNGLTKEGVVRLCNAYDVPLELTWTCWLGGSKPCGKCAACAKRLDAFKKAELVDPAEYEDV